MRTLAILIALSLVVVIPFRTFGQLSSAVPENVRASYSIDRFGDGIINEMIYGIPLPAPKVVGDTYIDANWNKGRIFLYERDKFIDGYAIRYDLDRQELEVQTPQGVKVVPGTKIKSFVTFEAGGSPEGSIYVNAREFSFPDGNTLDGFLKVVVDGPMAFMSAMTVVVKRPDYNEAMNVGNQNYRIAKREKFFYALEGKVQEVPVKKKELLGIFPSLKRASIDKFITDKRIKTNDEEGLALIFKQYNGKGF
jgi:hypothetical protein